MARTSNTLIKPKEKQMTKFIVNLPLPDVLLSPNMRKHWTVTSQAAKVAREASKEIFEKRLEEMGMEPPHWKRYQEHLFITAYDNRGLDLDNLLAATKHYRDALQDVISPKRGKYPAILGAGIVKNDKGCRRIVADIEVNPYNYGIVLTVEPIED